MTTRAPGKIVISGAYVVLRGAPAVVTAVGRYAEADAAKSPEFVTPEVTAALEELLHGAEKAARKAPWFDAAPLRDDRGKLGLGSSAAILAASLGALLPLDPHRGEEEWRQRVYEIALLAHRRAQGGGSGIDVAASVFGGTLLVRLPVPLASQASQLDIKPVTLPRDLHVEVWALGQPTSTAQFVKAVFALEHSQPRHFEALFGAQYEAATEAASALERSDTRGFLEGLRAQLGALDALGTATGVPIVVDAVRRLAQLAHPAGTFLPAGAGGGDVAFYAGTSPSSEAFRAAAGALGLRAIEAPCGARGLHPVDHQ